MNKKLQDLFNLPTQTDDTEEDTVEYVQLEDLDMQEMLDQVDKIDAALPQLPGRDSFDAEFDDYASKSIEIFDDLVELSKSVEDKNVPSIIDAASKMMNNALNAKSLKLDKKLKLIKLQIDKAKLDLEVSKLELHKAIHKPDENETKVIEGSVFGSRADVIKAIAAATKKDSK
jgi:hypothetical protein